MTGRLTTVAQIADRLHDQLLPLLAVLRQDLLEAPGHEHHVAMVDEALAVSRAVLTGAHPDVAYQALEEALESVARGPCADAGLSLFVDIDFDCRKLSRQQYALVVGAVRELARNVAEHARAANVGVRGVRQPGGWRVTVSDDGSGIDPVQADRRRELGHLGLKRLRRELRELDGRLVVRSGPDGTSVDMHLRAPEGVEP